MLGIIGGGLAPTHRVYSSRVASSASYDVIGSSLALITGRGVRLLIMALGLSIGILGVGPVPSAQAALEDDLKVFVQPLSGCLVSRVGNLYCQGALGPPLAISPNTAENAVLWRGIAYALCWTTAGGATYPEGSTCSETGSALATGHDFSYVTAATFPVIFTGNRDQGCLGWPNPEANSFLFWVANTGPCTFTIPFTVDGQAPDSTATFTLDVGDAQQPTITGTLPGASTGVFTVGDRTPLQLVTCKINEYIGNPWVGCPGVMLNWSVVTGKRSCVIMTNRNTTSETVGTVSVRFRKPGTCVLQGSYPAVPGQSLAFSTPQYTYIVTSRGG